MPLGKPAITLAATLLILAASPLHADLSVGWISRTPKIDFVWESTNPTREGWPEEGQRVTWVAHVWNLSGQQQNAIGWRWTIDGVTVAEGTASIPVSGPTKFELPWTWTFQRKRITFEIDTQNRVPEGQKQNNRLSIDSDALAVGFWVEQTFWEKIRDKLFAAGVSAVTFADWMQIRIRQYNSMAALARYPETPDGVLDRWRIDEIHIVPDGALPIVPPGSDVPNHGPPSGWATLYPDTSDRTVDLQWGFPTKNLDFYGNNPFTLLYDSLIHELGHVRYLVDVYAWRLDSTDRVEITPGPLPDRNGNLFITSEWGFMNTQWGFIDRYSAIALNRIAGRRAVTGNFIEASNLGIFLNDLPEKNRIRLVTQDGTTFPGRTVRVYASSSAIPDDWMTRPYQHHIDDTPEQTLTADTNGAVEVGRNPFSDDKLTILAERSNVIAILEVVDGPVRHWAYLESRLFNLAYWRGETAQAEYTVLLDPPLCAPPGVGSNGFAPRYESVVTTPEVTFQWLATRGYGYELWWSVDNGPAQHVEVTAPVTAAGTVSHTMPLPDGRIAWWILARDPNADPSCAPRPSAIYYFDLDTDLKSRRRPIRR